MHAKRVGTIEPVKEIAQITKKYGVVFHTDAVATVGTIPVDVKSWEWTHSLGWKYVLRPKGVGASGCAAGTYYAIAGWRGTGSGTPAGRKMFPPLLALAKLLRWQKLI